MNYTAGAEHAPCSVEVGSKAWPATQARTQTLRALAAVARAGVRERQ